MASNVQNVQSADIFDKIIRGASTVAVNFWAPWSQPSKQLDLVFEELAKENTQTRFLRVQAEEVPDITDRFGITVVPYFILLTQGELIARIEGADAAGLTQAVQKHFALASAPTASGPALTTTATNGAAARNTPAQSLEQSIKDLVNSKPVMLFMKGTPNAPRCGFSRKVVDALTSTGEHFGTFDILTDDSIRQGIKKYSDWPTFPQLYVGGELLGGCDIVMEMQQAGELKEIIEEMKSRT